MTSHELARRLLTGEDLPVYYGYPAHDYWKTEIAGDITEVEEDYAEWSEYHSKMQVSDQEKDSFNPGDEKFKRVILLR